MNGKRNEEVGKGLRGALGGNLTIKEIMKIIHRECWAKELSCLTFLFVFKWKKFLRGMSTEQVVRDAGEVRAEKS